MLIDSHCHLDLDTKHDAQTLLTNARQAGVSQFLCVAVDVETFPQILHHATTQDGVFASVGVHPNAQDVIEPTVEQLVDLAAAPQVIAIGETGLDYFRTQGDVSWQQQRFVRHIEAAREINKPLIIHTRESTADSLKILRQQRADQIGGVMHCFVEDWEIAKQVMDLGFYISFSGIVTFKSALQLQQVATKIPLDRMLIETDSPYLAPVPYRGKINQPAYVRQVAEFIAKLRHQSLDEIAYHTSQNFHRLFKCADAGLVLEH
jgi:TatD DNase family protein